LALLRWRGLRPGFQDHAGPLRAARLSRRSVTPSGGLAAYPQYPSCISSEGRGQTSPSDLRQLDGACAGSNRSVLATSQLSEGRQPGSILILSPPVSFDEG